MSVKQSYETFHDVIITEGNIQDIIKLTEKYVPLKALLDKAFDLLDQTLALTNSKKLSELTINLIAEALYKNIGIPITSIIQTDLKSHKKCEHSLKKRVVEQDEVMSKIINALNVSEAVMNDETKPLNFFIFLGAIGIGKRKPQKELRKVCLIMKRYD